jgi:hypothetical protein
MKVTTMEIRQDLYDSLFQVLVEADLALQSKELKNLHEAVKHAQAFYPEVWTAQTTAN